MIRETIALTIRELKHWYRVKIQLFMTLIMPLVWLGLFGQAFRIEQLIGPSVGPGTGIGFEAIFSGAPNYFSFMSIGMLCVVVLFTCMFSGMSIVWDRRFGFLKKLQVAPISRGVIPLSRILASVVRALIQAGTVFVIALAFIYVPGLEGLSLASGFGVIDLVLMFFILFLLALGFSALFTSIALTIENQETLMGIVNLLNLPLMFASAALFPTMMMPDWLRGVANYNPITFAADGMRQLAFNDPSPLYSVWVDILGLVIFSLIFVGLGWLVARNMMKR